MKPESLAEKELFSQIERLLPTLSKGGGLLPETVLLKSLLEEMAEGVIIAGSEGERQLLNSSAQRMFGRSNLSTPPMEKWAEMFGLYRVDGSTLFDPADLPLVRAIRGEATDGVEIFLRNDDIPQGLFLSVRGRPLRDDQGLVRGGIIFCENITRLKQEQIRAQRLADLVAVSPVGIIETATDTRVVSWNSSAEKIYGYRPEEIVGKPYSLLVPPHKISLMGRQVQKLLRGEPVESHETLRVRKDGRIIVTWCSASPLLDPQGRVRGFALVTRDITHSSLPAIAEQVLDAILVVSMAGLVTAWNPGAEKFFGYSKEEAIGKGFFSLFPEEAKKDVRRLYEAAKAGETFCDFATHGKKKNGGIPDISLSISPCKNQDGEVVGLSLVVRDMTELRLAESRISQWKSIVDSSSEGVARDDLNGKILYWNKGCERIYGYSEADVMGKPFSMLLPEGTKDEFPKIVDYIKEGHAAQYEGVRRRKDGQLITISATLSPLRDGSGNVSGASIFIRDVTEQVRLKEALKRQEEQLARIQKMEVVGRMAGGLAHDFNNLLTVISVNSQLLKSEGLGEEGLKSVENILNGVDRAADLTRQLLVFSRKQPSQPKRLDLNQLVSEEARLLQSAVTKAFPLDCELGEKVPEIDADAMELRQIFMNLVINARDAMPGGGRILFRTQNWDSTGADPEGAPMPPGKYAWLSVQDWGTGMDAETKNRIFEPFFTTKAEGKGTGLGLAMVYSIVAKCGGKIWVESGLGKGTTFHLCFPASQHLTA